MKVLMFNFLGEVWGVRVGGKSGFWDKDGNLILEMGVNGEGFLLVEKDGEIWIVR